MTAAKTLGSAALSPFWLLGRLIGLVGSVSLWVWQAFLDGLGTTDQDRSSLDFLVLVWLVVLTVWMLLR